MFDIASVLAALDAPRYPLRDDLPQLPSTPGLYAIYGDEDTWTDLGIEPTRPEFALYIGKAEDSLLSRDIEGHFGDGRTGSSTVRRSFAALLCEKLMLTAIPRNTAKPGYFANYGLAPADDAKLTAWMRQRLRFGVWPREGMHTLAQVEQDVLQRLNPPLNIAGVRHPHRTALQAARKRMADQARAWSPSSSIN